MCCRDDSDCWQCQMFGHLIHDWLTSRGISWHNIGGLASPSSTAAARYWNLLSWTVLPPSKHHRSVHSIWKLGNKEGWRDEAWSRSLWDERISLKLWMLSPLIIFYERKVWFQVQSVKIIVTNQRGKLVQFWQGGGMNVTLDIRQTGVIMTYPPKITQIVKGNQPPVKASCQSL